MLSIINLVISFIIAIKYDKKFFIVTLVSAIVIIAGIAAIIPDFDNHTLQSISIKIELILYMLLLVLYLKGGSKK